MISFLMLSCALNADPLVFAPESVSLNARSKAGAPPTCDVQLFLSARPGPDVTVLSIAAVDLPACLTDQGERLALTWKPDQRPGWRKPERGVLRLPLSVAAPRKACHTLAALSGSAQILLAQGEAAVLDVSLQTKGPAGPEVTVTEIKPKRVVITLTQRLTQRLAEATAGDARVDVQPQADGSARVVISADATSCRLRWWPDAATSTSPIAIARIDLPGGIPGSEP